VSYIVLDTDVASSAFKERLSAALVARLVGRHPCITFVTLAELTQWVELRGWGIRNREELTAWLDAVVVLPYAHEIARTWGRISASGIKRGRRRPANDTWVASCALAYGLPLATLNVKDYQDFAEHHGLTLVTA
jgi:toxin FitB